jgi:hypothetical protein
VALKRLAISGLLSCGVMTAAACSGAPKVVHVAPDESQPHFTWEIRTGGEFGGARFVCGSRQPKTPCELAPSSGVSMYLHLHAAAMTTNYLGVWKAPFLQGWKPSDYRELSGVVEPGDDPHAISVSGLVTSTPGESTLSVRLEAAQEGVAGGRTLSLDVPVIVAK